MLLAPHSYPNSAAPGYPAETAAGRPKKMSSKTMNGRMMMKAGRLNALRHLVYGEPKATPVALPPKNEAT